MEKPSKFDVFIYALMKEARTYNFSEFLEEWDINNEEYSEINDWFKKELNIRL